MISLSDCAPTNILVISVFRFTPCICSDFGLRSEDGFQATFLHKTKLVVVFDGESAAMCLVFHAILDVVLWSGVPLLKLLIGTGRLCIGYDTTCLWELWEQKHTGCFLVARSCM